MTTGRATRRQAAGARLRRAFLAEAGPRVEELALLLRAQDDPATRESGAQTLDRMERAADALGLDAIAGAARAAAGAGRGGGRIDLQPLARALRDVAEPRSVGEIAVVTHDPAALGLHGDGAACCEPVRFYESAGALAETIRATPPHAIVLPSTALGAVPGLVEAYGAPVFAYGGTSALEVIRAAADLGVSGWLDAPLDRGQVLTAVRREAWRRSAARARLLLATAPGAERDALVAALEGEGVDVDTVADPASLLDRAAGFELVLVADLGGVAAHDLVRWVRMRPGCDALSVFTVGPARPARALDAGADAVLASGSSPTSIAKTAASQLTRRRGGPRASVAGMPRPALLDAVDRELARTRRRVRPMAAAVVALEAPSDDAVRRFASCLVGGLRAYDLVGRLGAASFLAVLSECGEGPARQRVDAVVERFGATPEGRGVGVAVGVVDSETVPPDALLLRAEQAMIEARAGR